MIWPLVKLGDIFKVTSGGTPSRKNPEYYENGNIHWIKTGNLHQKYIETASEFITEEALKSSSTKLFPPNTVLVAMYGATIGACAILNIEACTNQACAAFTPNEKVDPLFLYYFLKSNKSNFIRAGAGGAQPNISGTFLKNFQIPLPPLPVQKKIAAVLENADTLRGQCQQMEKELNTLAHSVFLDMFGDPVTNPKSWPESTLGDVLKIKHGFAFKSEYFTNNGEYVLLTPGNFYEEGGYRDRGDKQKFYTGEVPEGYTLKKNDLLVAMTEQAEGLLGSSILIPSSNMFLHNQRLGLVNFLNNQNKTFFSFLFNSDSVRKAIQASATGIKVKHTSPTKLEAISIGVPPLELQDSFEKVINKINIQIKNIKTEQKESESQFNSLMQSAFIGELELKDVA